VGLDITMGPHPKKCLMQARGISDKKHSREAHANQFRSAMRPKIRLVLGIIFSKSAFGTLLSQRTSLWKPRERPPLKVGSWLTGLAEGVAEFGQSLNTYTFSIEG